MKTSTCFLICQRFGLTTGFVAITWILLGAFPAEAGTNSNLGRLTVREVLLGKLPIAAKNAAAVLSDDCQHVAIPCQRGLRWTILHDGVEGQTYQSVNSMMFSRSSGRLAYVARKGLNEDVLVLGGKEILVRHGIAPDSVKFSPDGLRYAYVIGISNSLGGGSPMYDVDEKGASLAGSGATGKKRMLWGGPSRVVVDGKESRDYLSVATRKIMFSPDGKHVAYHASAFQRPTTPDLGVVVRDGVESNPYQGILEGTPVFSPDSQHLAFAGERDGKWFAVHDGKEGEPYDGIFTDSLKFTPDSQRLVYRARRGDRWYLVVGGKETRPVDNDEFGDPIYRPDSQRMAIATGSDSRSHWIIDGKPEQMYDGVSDLSFSPDSNRFTYMGKRGNRWHIVTDGAESRAYDRFVKSPVCFSPDSRHVAYLTERDGKFRLVLDGKEGSEYDWVGNCLAFSSDSRHVAFLAGRGRVVSPDDQGEKVVVVVDGRESGPYVGIFPGLAFAGSSAVRVIAVRMNYETANYELVRVEVSVPEI